MARLLRVAAPVRVIEIEGTSGAARALSGDLAATRQPIVIVHSQSPEVDEMHETLGLPIERGVRLRRTPAVSMEVVLMTVIGLVNTRLVAELNCKGRTAVGLSGADFGLMRSDFINEPVLGRVGGPPRVDVDPIQDLLERGVDVVVSPICIAPDGGLLNVRAEVVAQSLAVALGADVLDFVVKQLSENSAQKLEVAEVERLVRSEDLPNAIVPKLQAAVAAIDGGVPRVRVGTLSSMAEGTATEVRA